MIFSLFSKPTLTVEQQLTDLAACGLPLSPRATVDDLFTVATREDMERNPFDHLVAALGFTKEDESDTPLCDNLWMCDFQCIHDHGDYVKVIERFRILCHRRLWFENVSDFVETEFNKAWVEFDVDGDRVHWNAVVKDDWLDPFLLKKLDLLLAEHTNLRIYSNTADFGQSALLGCFTNEEFERFHQISHIPFLPLAQQS